MIQIKPEKAKVTKKVAGNAKSSPAVPVTKRGRPPTGKAMTNAERQAKFKALKKALNG